MIHVRDLAVRYGAVPALQVSRLDISSGECVILTGPSGCGKTTLARVFSGLIPHAIPAQLHGTVCVAGKDVKAHAIADLAQHVGAVFQNPSTQLFHLRVEDDIGFGPRNLGLDEHQVQQRVDSALGAVGLLSLRHRNPAELSGGQKQLVAIGAALAMQPQILVLDEPTASLDVDGIGKVTSALRKLHVELGITIVLIEHRLAQVAQLAHRIIVMDHGQIVADRALDDIAADRRFFHQMGLRRPASRPLDTWETLLSPNGHPPRGLEPLLDMRAVSAGYAGKRVIEELSLTIYPGEFAALVGPNGAGKSTVALVAAGLLKPAAGFLRFAGRKRIRSGVDVSLLFQNPTEQLFTDSVDEEVAFGPLNYRRFNAQTHQTILAETDLLDLRARVPAALSMGQQQRTALAASVSLRPRLLILDEPTLGQDWQHLQRLMDFLTILNRQGTAILLITHDYKLVHRYAKRVILLANGRIIVDGQLRHQGDTS